MEVILREDVEKLGKRGATVQVKDGYARNFLLPHRLAVPSTEVNRHQVEAEQRQWAAREAQGREAAELMRQRLAAESVRVAVKTGPDDQLFGAVTADDIVQGLAAIGLTITKRQVHLEAPIKALGEHEVALRVHADVPITARVRVVKA